MFLSTHSKKMYLSLLQRDIRTVSLYCLSTICQSWEWRIVSFLFFYFPRLFFVPTIIASITLCVHFFWRHSIICINKICYYFFFLCCPVQETHRDLNPWTRATGGAEKAEGECWRGCRLQNPVNSACGSQGIILGCI